MSKKKETGQYKIPFDKKGNLLHYAYPEGRYAYSDQNQVWKENYKFFATLDFYGFARGRSAAYMHFKDKRNGLVYSMFLKDFSDAVPSMVFGELEGEFTFTKRGENYGLKYLGRVSNVGFPEVLPLTCTPEDDSVGQKRTCNQHLDCDEADQKAEANGKGAEYHCTIEDCEDCFGT